MPQVLTIVEARDSCRVCGSKLSDVLDLGYHFLHRCIKPGDKSPEYVAPLELMLCETCKLLQLKHTVPPDYLFREFFYESGINQTMRGALLDVVAQVKSRTVLEIGDVVADIGSNDSTLLRSYGRGPVKIGFEPANNLMEKARLSDGTIVNDYFSAEKYWQVTKQKAKVVTAIAMFYDLDDPVGFLESVNEILDPDGLFIIQMNYMPLMLWHNSFDNIVHEHLFYPGLLQMERMLGNAGLGIKDVEFNDVNGGSFRLYIQAHRYSEVDWPPRPKTYQDIKQLEQVMRLDDPIVYHTFAKRIQLMKEELTRIVSNAAENGKSIYVYGASTRGSTTLQFCGFDNKTIKAAAERNPNKVGMYTAGTHIPIISEEQMRKERPDYLLVLPWQFLPEFLEREKEYLSSGGHFIVPMPNVKVIP